MWTCPKCNRIFNKENQPHSCETLPLEKHFENKAQAKELFDYLLKQVSNYIGEYKVISLPCCVHLFGKYDFLAALPKKDKLEIRFALDKKLDSPKLKQFVPLSAHLYKNCVDICSKQDIDKELIGWLKTSYYLKN
jgi:hypothetical protein